MRNMFGAALQSALDPAALAVLGPTLLVLVYFFSIWDARREGSPAAADTQIGIKAAIHVFAVVGILIAAGGIHAILSFVLGKMGDGGGGSVLIKMGIGNVVAGAGAFVACTLLLLPRTNWQEHNKVTRLSYGVVAGVSGILAITSLATFLSSLIGGARWGGYHPTLASAIVFGALGFFALAKLGKLSGWVAPAPAAAGFPPGAGGGYDPNQAYAQQQQQGYAQQPAQGGYPPQGGGYPPQGGGAPPAGGGYPPQGGGAPPQGGGGLPPPAGGGYPPAGGGY